MNGDAVATARKTEVRSRSSFRFGIIRFLGSTCEEDALAALRDVLGFRAELVWYDEQDLSRFDAVLLPGGFSYGDALRAGAVARFSPVMAAVERFAAQGRPVLGICNGFQILCEAGLLPGALTHNLDLRFHCHDVHLRVETEQSAFSAACKAGEVLRLPIAHGEGRYVVSDAELQTMEREGRIVFRYVNAAGEPVPEANPNGSTAHVAGICNREGNVVGLMPHPERAVEAALGGTDGRRILASCVRWLEERSATRVR